MKDVLKMIRFDLVTAGSLTVPYVLAFIGLSLALSLFAMPLGILCFAAPLVIFGPAREAAGAEQKKIYGILPVRKSAVTRAAFWENTVMLLVGEVLALLFLLISDKGALSGILPESIAEMLESIKTGEYSLSFNDMAVTVALLSAYLCILSAYLEMEAEIHGHDSDIKNLLIALSATAIIIAVIAVLVNRGVLPPFRKWLTPEKASGRGLIILAANAAAIAVSAAMCERTVKKTADMEL